MRPLVAALAVLLWLLLGYFFYDSSCDCCQENTIEKTAIAAPASKKVVEGPILFNWEKGTPVIGTGWDAKKQGLIDGLKENYKLEIIGYYDADEKNNTSYDNLGLARAAATADLFAPGLESEQIKLYGRLRNVKDQNNAFESVNFNYKMFTKSIKELDDKTLIYFPFNSTNKLNDDAVERYLDDVAERVKSSGEIVKLSGHTDDVGEVDSNEKLGMRRAEIVKNYLMSKGVPAASIETRSGGELEPVASNDTDEGRAQNRRTELQIVKP